MRKVVHIYKHTILLRFFQTKHTHSALFSSFKIERDELECRIYAPFCNRQSGVVFDKLIEPLKDLVFSCFRKRTQE